MQYFNLHTAEVYFFSVIAWTILYDCLLMDFCNKMDQNNFVCFLYTCVQRADKSSFLFQALSWYLVYRLSSLRYGKEVSVC